MKPAKQIAILLLCVLVGVVLLADVAAPSGYQEQLREDPDAPPSRDHPLGTDELGRDRLSRLLYGSRVSLLLAPAAASLATLIALVVGVVAGYAGGRVERLLLALTDLMASMPWLLLLLTVRAVLPLDVSAGVSVCMTFALLGLLGWTSAARVIRAAVIQTVNSDHLLQARAAGCSPGRLLFIHVGAGLRPVLLAQFWLCVPLFLLAEANLGMLGLGVTEPLPSWGNLLAELVNYYAVLESPWLLAPVLMLFAVLGSFQLLLREKEVGR
jgi:ABC-type dipeptide/oligopeptide/nickel transport system permease subunit